LANPWEDLRESPVLGTAELWDKALRRRMEEEKKCQVSRADPKLRWRGWVVRCRELGPSKFARGRPLH
jgi:hypothetical protein